MRPPGGVPTTLDDQLVAMEPIFPRSIYEWTLQKPAAHCCLPGTNRSCCTWYVRRFIAVAALSVHAIMHGSKPTSTAANTRSAVYCSTGRIPPTEQGHRRPQDSTCPCRGAGHPGGDPAEAGEPAGPLFFSTIARRAIGCPASCASAIAAPAGSRRRIPMCVTVGAPAASMDRIVTTTAVSTIGPRAPRCSSSPGVTGGQHRVAG